MPSRRQAGLTLVELLVIIALLLILAFLPIHLDGPINPSRGQLTQGLSNLKQLHLATQQMALDRTTTGETNIGWPGDTGGTFTNWTAQLIAGGYLTAADLSKLLSAPKRQVPLGKIPLTNTTAVLAYAVKEESPGDTVFLTSANFTNLPGHPTLDRSLFLYGGTNASFIIFRKDGAGVILNPNQTNATNLLGPAVPLLR